MSAHLAISILQTVCSVPTESNGEGRNGTFLWLAREFTLIPIKLMSAVTLMTVSALDWGETKAQGCPSWEEALLMPP